MNLKNLKRAFPTFDVFTLPTMPEGFKDVSWNQDCFPHFYNHSLRLHLLVDYADPSLSEFEEERKTGEAKRFCLYIFDEDRHQSLDQTILVQSNEWQDVLAEIKVQSVIRLTVMSKRIRTLTDGKILIEALVDNGLAFHLEDDPLELECFTAAEALQLRKRQRELYNLDWGTKKWKDNGEEYAYCPIGYMMDYEVARGYNIEREEF